MNALTPKRQINPEARQMGARLRQLREELDFTQAEVGRKLGMTERGYGAYESGRARIIATDLPDIARALGVDRDLLAIRLGLISPEAARRQQPVRVGNYVLLQVVDGAVVDAGNLGWIPTDDGVMVELDEVRGRDLMPIRVSGTCMEPEILPGDLVIIDRSNLNPRPGDRVVVVTDMAEVMVKRFERDEQGPRLEDNQGRVIRPNGAKIQGVVEFLQRRVRG